MDGKLVPALGRGALAMFAHRVLALAGRSLLVLWAMVRARTMAVRSPAVVRLSTARRSCCSWPRSCRGRERVHAAEALGAWSLHVALVGADLGDASWRSRRWRCGCATPILGRRRRGRCGSRRRRRTQTEPTARSHTVDARHDPAYVRLTKPRIIVLLLITTVPAMILARRGIPSIWLIARDPGRRHARGRVGERDQHVPRSRHRPSS